MSGEIATGEGNHAQVPSEEKVVLNIDNNHVCSYESFSQDKNQWISHNGFFEISNFRNFKEKLTRFEKMVFTFLNTLHHFIYLCVP